MSDEKKPYIINGERATLEEYRKTKYEDLRIRVPIGKKEKIKDFVKTTGESLNSFVNNAIDEKMEREKNNQLLVPIILYNLWVPFLCNITP